MNILLVGGAGFIGRHLAEHLLKENLVIYDNLSNSSKKKIIPLIDRGVQFIKGDILDFKKLLEVSRGMDVIIHLAAKTDVIQSVKYPQETYNINVKGTINVLKCCAKNKAKIIFASSAAVYGDCKDTITEMSDTNPKSPYGKSKLDAENKIKNYSKKYKFDAVILRLFNVYGNGQNKKYSGVITKFLKNTSEDKPLVIYGDGAQTRDFVSVYDVADAFACAISSNHTNTYNIASGKSVSINELARTILKTSGKHLGIIHKKEKPGEIRFSRCDISLAKKELGFYPKTALKKGLVAVSD